MNTIDLFSGAGGLSLGLGAAGAAIVACVEIKRDSMDTYCSHTPNAIHFNEDIRGVNFKRFRNKVQLVAGGPPCQPFSLGGLRKSNLDSRDMIPEFVRCLRECQPDFFLLENVPGLLSAKTRSYFQSTLNILTSLGYCLNWSILNSADYGVPQKRKRLFILGSKTEYLRFPVPTHGSGTKKTHVTSSRALGAAPIGEAPNCPVKYARFPDLRPSPYAGQIYNGGGRPINPAAPCHTILASSGGYKTHWIDALNIAPEYHRHLLNGGKPWEGNVPGARRLSVKECAVIQTFPPNLQLSGTQSSQYSQVGDAVPPALAEVLGKAILAQINGNMDKASFLYVNPECRQFQGELTF